MTYYINSKRYLIKCFDQASEQIVSDCQKRLNEAIETLTETLKSEEPLTEEEESEKE